MRARHWSEWPEPVAAALRRGVASRRIRWRSMPGARSMRGASALTRYYLDAGAGGLAVSVHTTQFAIREAGLYRPVLELAMATANEWTSTPPIMIAGLVGRTAQAVQEAKLAASLGLYAGLLSLAAMKGASEDELIAHADTIAREIPLVGFYLQPAVGGIALSSSFWRRFAESTTSSPSRSRRSTATARSTSCAAWSPPARRSASCSIPATTITSSSIS